MNRYDEIESRLSAFEAFMSEDRVCAACNEFIAFGGDNSRLQAHQLPGCQCAHPFEDGHSRRKAAERNRAAEAAEVAHVG